VTHTTAEHVVMDGIGESVVGPVQPWDALVCTSPQVQAMVRYMVDQFADYLMARFGGNSAPAMNLPLIPLGVECDQFDATTEAAKRARAQMRRAVGIGDDDIAYLFVGRLTHVEKANPLAMYLALEKASKRTKRKLHLIHAGWFASPEIERAFKAAATGFAPSIRHHWLDGRKPEIRNNVWFAGDVFTSLSDNIQETFGLTPIEGMAAGLPVVVSDWDGYRYTVRNGKEGIAVNTFMPPPGDGKEIAFRYASGMDGYGRFCLSTAQSIAVDVEACADAYARLADDAVLRRKFGESGRKHARETFDWGVVMASYQTLWQELAEKRAASAEVVPVADDRPDRPLRDDPFKLFESYPTAFVDGATIVEAAADAGPARMAELRRTPLANMMSGILLDNDGLTGLLALVARGRTTVAALAAEIAAPAPVVRRSIGWLAKNDLIRLLPAAEAAATPAPKSAAKPAPKATARTRR
jgi:glycosyltransferase involved in cell wall biosynthesis